MANHFQLIKLSIVLLSFWGCGNSSNFPEGKTSTNILIPSSKIQVETKQLNSSTFGDVVCNMQFQSSRIQDSDSLSTDNSILFLIHFKDSISNAVGKSHNARAMIQEVKYHTEGCGLACVSPKQYDFKTERKNITENIEITIDRSRAKSDSLFYSFGDGNYFGLMFDSENSMKSLMVENKNYFPDKNRPVMLYRELKIKDYEGRTGFLFGYLVYSVETEINWDEYFNSLKFALWLSNPDEEGPKVDDFFM